MSQPENTFISSVHRHLPEMNDFYRMKNHNQYNGGIADVWYSGKKDLWIEYKFIVVPKRNDTVIDLIAGTAKSKPALSRLQQEWLSKRHAEGRQVAVVVGSKDGGVWFDGVSWKGTYTADAFKSALLTRAELAKLILTRCS